jgi:hypothetical protein
MEEFNICGYDAILLNGNVQVSAPNEDEATKIIQKLTKDLLKNNICKIRINLPDKITFVIADKEYPGDLLLWAEPNNDKKTLN